MNEGDRHRIGIGNTEVSTGDSYKPLGWPNASNKPIYGHLVNMKQVLDLTETKGFERFFEDYDRSCSIGIREILSLKGGRRD